MSASELDLTPTEWDILQAEHDNIDHGDDDGAKEYAEALRSALDKILAHRPRPVLEDGIYEEVDEEGESHIVYVRAGRFSTYLNLDGSLQVGWPLPDDTSGWTRLRVLADDEVAVKLGGYFVAEDGDREPAIWREREGRELPVLYRHYATGALFDALAAALPHRDDR